MTRPAVGQQAACRRFLYLRRPGLNASETSEGLTPTQASVLGLIVAHGPLGLARLLEPSVQQFLCGSSAGNPRTVSEGCDITRAASKIADPQRCCQRR
jgi:hypothetical protein